MLELKKIGTLNNNDNSKLTKNEFHFHPKAIINCLFYWTVNCYLN